MSALSDYIVNHFSGIIQDIVFAFVGVFLGLLFTPKNSDPHIHNGTRINQVLQIITQNMNTTHNHYPSNHSPNTSKSSSKSNDDETPLGIYFFVALIAAFFFYKYHVVLMNYTISFIVMGLASTVTVAIKLYLDNQYDNLNKYWTVISFLIVIVDFFTLKLMSGQLSGLPQISSISEFISVVGMQGILEFSYYALGFVFIQFPNLLLLNLLIHMFAVNQYLARGGRVSAFFVRKTSRFVSTPAGLITITALVCAVSLLLSSGLLFKWVSKGIENNTATFEHIFETKQ
ncbi:hypothetical protein P40081_27460 [Paenibacillus sp. FSL P4-0081]|uniref:hypothetical protein n=1 Tax=unclassified Paenibacillus TaxID=185978 RepID=UPI0004F8AF72|nr:hypothetical protein [Paenibacillus sp. FSL P4-0081]AIQ31476.1 hypothetical protein P40081_27460 [Paenibacillus sp. FSL P4-0081]